MKQNTKSAGKLVVLENSDSISAEAVQIENRIRQRAYEISQSRGHAGREIEDWLSAESEIISVPPLELSEKDGTFVVQLALTGVSPDNVQVVATPDQLLIKGDFEHHHHEDLGTVHQCEFKSATVFRTIRFPRPIKLNNLQVQFEDGMLRITAQRRDVNDVIDVIGETPKTERRARTPRPAARSSRPKTKAS